MSYRTGELNLEYLNWRLYPVARFRTRKEAEQGRKTLGGYIFPAHFRFEDAWVLGNQDAEHGHYRLLTIERDQIELWTDQQKANWVTTPLDFQERIKDSRPK